MSSSVSSTFVHVCNGGVVHKYVHVCAGESDQDSGVLLCHSLSYSLKHDLSLNLEFTISARLANSGNPVTITASLLPYPYHSAGIAGMHHHAQISFYTGGRDLNLGPHVCTSSALSYRANFPLSR